MLSRVGGSVPLKTSGTNDSCGTGVNEMEVSCSPPERGRFFVESRAGERFWPLARGRMSGFVSPWIDSRTLAEAVVTVSMLFFPNAGSLFGNYDLAFLPGIG